MVRQRENDVWRSAYILLYKYGVNFIASMIIVFKLSIVNDYFVFLNPHDTFKLKRLLTV
jgi:hypothetical protein